MNKPSPPNVNDVCATIRHHWPTLTLCERRDRVPLLFAESADYLHHVERATRSEVARAMHARAWLPVTVISSEWSIAPDGLASKACPFDPFTNRVPTEWKHSGVLICHAWAHALITSKPSKQPEDSRVMTTTPRCPECRLRDGHKMSCDTGNRRRMRMRATTEPRAHEFDATSILTTLANSESPAREVCAPPSTPTESYGTESYGTCGGGSE